MAFKNPIAALSELIADSIIGAFIATGSAPNARWELSNIPPFNQAMRGFSGIANELQPAEIQTVAGGSNASLKIESQDLDDGLGGSSGRARLELSSEVNPNGTTAVLEAKTMVLTGGEVNITSFLPGSDINIAAGQELNLDSILGINALSTLNAQADLNVAGHAAVTGTLTPGKVAFTGSSISKLRYGIATVVVPAGASTADLAVAHGMGNAPTVAFATAANVTTFYANIASTTAVNVNLRAVQRDGVAGAANVSVFWLAIWA